MGLKDIVTLIEQRGPNHAMKLAVDLAARTDAHLTGLALAYNPVVAGYLVAPMPVDYLEQARQQSQAEAQESLKSFHEAVRLAGIKSESRLITMESGAATEPFVAQTRVCDLIVIGQYDEQNGDAINEVLIEAALFDSGVPVMIVPYVGTPELKSDHVMIAWDGSRTAMRAAHAALPMLELAGRISVVMVEAGSRQEGEPGADLATYLARHGFDVTLETIASPETSTADALLNFISDRNVDLVVMGGYGHSRMREFILGGATQRMLRSMSVPVIMAH